MSRNLTLLLIVLLLPGTSHAAETLRVAVAANFKPTLELLTEQYSRETDVRVDISIGSTGALYAQIKNGAPFHLFLAADAERPQRLEREGLSRRRQAYAMGRLVFWRPGTPGVNQDSVSPDIAIAIANPKHAPYGEAASNVLTRLKVEPERIIRGNNVAQAYAFVATGNAVAGFVSLAQVRAKSVAPDSYWIVPTEFHTPIRQELVVLKTAPPGADHLADFIFASDTALTTAGYLLPTQAQQDQDD